MTDSLSFDSLIVGAGPAGLSAAIRLAQLNPERRIAVLEKGAQVGSHLLSGALFDPSLLDVLLPHWQKAAGFPFTPIKHERFVYLSKNHSLPLPTPKHLSHDGCGIISIGQLCQYLAKEAESLGVSIITGFAATALLWEDNKTKVLGVQINDEANSSIFSSHTFLAEGCRGYLSEQAIAAFSLREECDTQRYGLGVKEKWRVDPSLHHAGQVTHSLGWPLQSSPFGGGFLYHAEAPYIVVGFVSSLNYTDPQFSPFEQLQRYKAHPSHKALFESGQCVGYGARAINQGGWQSIPRCDFPGGYLIGCSAGFVDSGKLQGIHHAMQTAILCAEHSLANNKRNLSKHIKQSPTGEALYRSRNIKPSYRFGNYLGLLITGIDQWLFRGKAPWTLTLPPPDHTRLRKKKITKPWKADQVISFDRLTQVSLSNTHHAKGSSHLQVDNRELTLNVNLVQFGGPEQHYCPAHVYEYVEKEGKPWLQINAENCLHCKACSIKDPMQNIYWTPPNKEGGPNYIDM